MIKNPTRINMSFLLNYFKIDYEKSFSLISFTLNLYLVK